MMSETNESDFYKLYKESVEDDNIFTVVTTLATGLEWQAVDECKEKVNPAVHYVKERGKIYFNISLDQFPKVQDMRSIDNIFIVADVRRFAFSADNRDSDLQLITNDVNNAMKLEKGLNAWKTVTRFPGQMYPSLEQFEAADKLHKKEKSQSKSVASVTNKGRKRGRDPSIAEEDNIVKYRVTCERTGVHTFESGQVARIIGGELQTKYHWLVDLTMYHLEIVCNVIHNELVTCLRVTHESKHRRNITFFGPTTLRATVCYNLLRLANPKSGEIIIDPMCGGGSIPIEAAIVYPDSYILCGDNHDKAVDRTKSNIAALTTKHRMDLIQWSVSELPLKDSYVDVIVTDMPFGKRSGSMSDNRVLYKKFLLELGRVVKPGTGRLVLLTYDRRSMTVALQAAGDLFRVIKTQGVNMGGLPAAVYVLKRSKISLNQFRPKLLKSSENKKAESIEIQSTDSAKPEDPIVEKQ